MITRTPTRADIGSEWDVGVFEVFDGVNLVALLWVTNPQNDLTQAIDFWGLGPNYVWPSSSKTKTFKYQWHSTLSANISTTAGFKAECDNQFGSGNSNFIKATCTPF